MSETINKYRINKRTISTRNTLSPTEQVVVKTLLYFDIFNYPLKIEEIYENAQNKICRFSEIAEAIHSLTEKKIITHHNNYYYVSENNSDLINNRITGNKKAITYLKKARFYSKLISCFPFVEAVFISGSLAKGVVDKKGDIDYFIITRPNRLWLCRTLLIMFKKLVLFNSKKYFCVNYFIDSKNIQIPDKNIFTATELVFAKAMYNPEVCRLFFEANKWSREFYPNKPSMDVSLAGNKNNRIVKHFSEWLFKGSLGELIDTWCFKYTLNHWKKKFKNVNEQVFDLNFRSRKNVSKHHPSGFQHKVLQLHQQKINNFELSHKVELA